MDTRTLAKLLKWTGKIAEILPEFHPIEEFGTFQLFVGWCASHGVKSDDLVGLIELTVPTFSTVTERSVLHAAICSLILIEHRRSAARDMYFPRRGRPFYMDDPLRRPLWVRYALETV